MVPEIGEFDDDALQTLEEYLSSDRAPGNGLGLSDLDGFLTALIVGPELVQPSKWLPVVWGHDEPQFEGIVRGKIWILDLGADPPWSIGKNREISEAA